MSKIKPERVAGIVALSYLVLIPVGALLAYQKLRVIDQDVTTIWEESFPGTGERTPLISRDSLKKVFGR